MIKAMIKKNYNVIVNECDIDLKKNYNASVSDYDIANVYSDVIRMY